MNGIVEIDKVWKTYRMGDEDVHALRGLSLSVPQGQYLAIMGASGSGKSTLLNLLGCLDRPTSGTYHLGGEDVSCLDDNQLSFIRSSKIGFIFQSYNLIQQLTVVENIEVPLYYQGWSEHDSLARALELAEVVGLSKRVNHRPMELSGGQQQRVAIARSLANNPLIILGDEPTGNLDSHTGAEILRLLDDLKSQGKTIITVTHDEHVANHAERIVVLADGEVAEERVGARP